MSKFMKAGKKYFMARRGLNYAQPPFQFGTSLIYTPDSELGFPPSKALLFQQGGFNKIPIMVSIVGSTGDNDILSNYFVANRTIHINYEFASYASGTGFKRSVVDGQIVSGLDSNDETLEQKMVDCYLLLIYFNAVNNILSPSQLGNYFYNIQILRNYYLPFWKPVYTRVRLFAANSYSWLPDPADRAFLIGLDDADIAMVNGTAPLGSDIDHFAAKTDDSVLVIDPVNPSGFTKETYAVVWQRLIEQELPGFLETINDYSS